MKKVVDSVGIAALLGLAVSPCASGQQFSTANDLVDVEGAAEAQAAQRRLMNTDEALDLFDSVSAKSPCGCMRASVASGQKSVVGHIGSSGQSFLSAMTISPSRY